MTTMFTVGDSDDTAEHFVRLLAGQGVATLAGVRFVAYSRQRALADVRAPQLLLSSSSHPVPRGYSLR